MKKIIFKITIILILLCFAINSFFTISAFADSKAGLNCPSSVTTGESFTVSLSFPSDTYGGQGLVKVTFPDNSTESKNITYIAGMNDYPNSVSFTAKGTGTAKVSVTGIRIVRADESEIEKNGYKEASITIKAKAVPSPSPSPVPSPTPTKTPSPTSNPSPTPTKTPTPSPTPTTKESFKDVNETVYTNERVNIRKSNSTSSDVVTTVDENTELKRTATGDKGWSKVEYNGKSGYIYSKYLTTNKPKEEEVTFKTVEEKMYAIKSCNLRKSYSTDSDVVGGLAKGEEVLRIGIGSNGWSKLKYEGKEVFVLSSLISSKKPEEDEETNTTNTVETNTVTNDIVDDNKEEREKQLEKIKEEVGVLPEVGTNPAVISFVIISALALIIALAIIYKNKNEI